MMKTDDITFRFKQFAVTDKRCGMKVGTDGVLIGALAEIDSCDRTINVADIGAGCGLISLMIAQRFPNALIDAVEIDSDADADLRINIDASPWKDRIRAINADFCDLTDSYDLIVSNPPFYKNGEISPEAQRAVARHSGRLSPLSLVDFSTAHLKSTGLLSMIIPVENADEVEAHALFSRLYLKRRVDISTSRRRGITRSFLEFSKFDRNSPSFSTLSTDSDAYRELTREFYLKH